MSMVSHELRVPLASIKESISIILDGSAGRIKDVQKKYLDIAKRNIDRLNRLISELLDFQKLEAGKMKFVMQSNDANEIVKEVYDTILEVWYWALKNNMPPLLVPALPIGKCTPDQILDKEQITELWEKLADLEGTEKWNTRYPRDQCCNRFETGFHIAFNGDVYPCPAVREYCGNVTEQYLGDIWEKNDFLNI